MVAYPLVRALTGHELEPLTSSPLRWSTRTSPLAHPKSLLLSLRPSAHPLTHRCRRHHFFVHARRDSGPPTPLMGCSWARAPHVCAARCLFGCPLLALSSAVSSAHVAVGHPPSCRVRYEDSSISSTRGTDFILPPLVNCTAVPGKSARPVQNVTGDWPSTQKCQTFPHPHTCHRVRQGGEHSDQSGQPSDSVTCSPTQKIV